MNIFVEYEAEPLQPSLSPEDRRRREKAAAELEAMLGKGIPKDIETEYGTFRVDTTDLESLIEHLLAMRLASPDRNPGRIHISLLTDAEYYRRVLSDLRALQSAEEFLWELFEPAFRATPGKMEGVSWLVAALLDNGQGEAWCKACRQSYSAPELITYDWSRSDFAGAEYFCPQQHVLLRTKRMILGELGAPYRHRVRENKSGG